MSELHFLIHVEDLELRRRLRVVMAKLELLSEGRAQPIERSHHGKPESTPPAEVVLGGRPDKPPPKDRSLFAWYLWHLERVWGRDNPQQRYRKLVLLAERDLERFIHPAPDSRRAGHLHAAGTTEKAEGERVIAWYEGVDSLEVAVIEDCSQAWVEKVRRQHGRRHDDGRPLPGWRGWDVERRQAEVDTLRKRGLSQQRAADKLGVSKRTVQKYWWRRSHAA